MGPARFFGYETFSSGETKCYHGNRITIVYISYYYKKKKKETKTKTKKKKLAFKYVLVIPLSLQADKKPLPEQVF